MKKLTAGLWALAAVPFLFPYSVQAHQEKKSVSVQCPLDKTKFTAWEIPWLDDKGGVDTDFCKHAYYRKQLAYSVWVCPTCHYAGEKKDFKTLSSADAERLRGKLKPAMEIRKDAPQEDIPGWVKYDLAAQAYALLSRDSLSVGKMYLHAAWAAREDGAVLNVDDPLYDELWEKYGLDTKPLDLNKQNRTYHDLKKIRVLESDINAGKYKDSARVVAHFIAAYIYRRHGEHAEARLWLDQLKKEQGVKPKLDLACKIMDDTMEIEKKYQKKAAERYTAALSEGVPAKTQPDILYILGELSRRLEDRASAEQWYKKCLDDPSATQTHKDMSKQQMQKASGIVTPQ